MADSAASNPAEQPTVAATEQPAATAPADAPAPADGAPPAADSAAPADAAKSPEKEKRPPLSPEEAEARKKERNEKRKEARNAARQAAKEARAAAIARGETPKPRARAAAKNTALVVPDKAAPKISVAKLPSEMTTGQLRALFEPHGVVLRAEVSKRRGRPTRGIVVFNTHAEVRRAFDALNGKHKCEGADGPVSIQYTNDAAALGDILKTQSDKVADCLKQYEYKQTVLRSLDAKDLLNRMVLTRSPPPPEVLTAAVLVHTQTASIKELVDCGMVKSGAAVQQLLRDMPVREKGAPRTAGRDARAKEAAPAIKLEKTFDAVVSRLDRLEKERWNRMAKANLRLDEYHRFRFVDILATPGLELWRWMVEDCEITPAEAGTCFYILSTFYGYAK